MILEIILINVLVVLSIIIIVETREYRRVSKSSSTLDSAIRSYDTMFATVVETIKIIESAYGKTTVTQQKLEDQLILLRSILEIHNRALCLDPELLKIIRNIEPTTNQEDESDISIP